MSVYLIQCFNRLVLKQCHHLSPQLILFRRSLTTTSASFGRIPRAEDVALDPYYEHTDEDPPEDPRLITVPLRLKSRLNKKEERESTKRVVRIKQIQTSRRGSSQAILSAKKPELNHYKGQSYGKGELPLISKGWKHRKSHGDFFTIHPATESSAFIELEDKDTFEKLGIHPKICQILEAEKIEQPTLVQAIAIPQILKGKNNLIAAETGCGKTLAYLLPLFEKVLRVKTPRMKRLPNQPLGLILAPTRELAEQIHKVACSLGYPLDVRVKLLQGGNVQSKASSPSTKECDILVTTISIISTLSLLDVYSLDKVFHMILDEADTLLDDSFSPEVIRFLGRFQFEGTAKNRVQISLVSATMPRSIESILGEVVPMDSLNRVTTPALHNCMKTVPQKFLRVRKMDKPSKILEILNKAVEKKSPTIIFTNKNATCSWLSKHITENGLDCVSLHGAIRPHRRKGLLDQYTNGEIDILVCTDIASRGIDTIRTKHVINYEFPKFLADYVHRCGRVGRVGSAPGGLITNLISGANEVEIVNQIEASVRRDEVLTRVNANIKRMLNAKYGMYNTIDPVKE